MRKLTFWGGLGGVSFITGGGGGVGAGGVAITIQKIHITTINKNEMNNKINQ